MYSDIHPISGTFLRIIAGLAGLVVFSLLQKSFIDDFRKMRNIKLTALLAGAALVGPIMGVLLTLYALRIAPVGIVTALVQVSPILLLPFDYFVLKKKITLKVVLGTFIAIGGAAILFIY
jgi:drug/metabolite transporter (DMT)-like permease